MKKVDREIDGILEKNPLPEGETDSEESYTPQEVVDSISIDTTTDLIVIAYSADGSSLIYSTFPTAVDTVGRLEIAKFRIVQEGLEPDEEES